MTVGLKTSDHFIDEKKGALEDALKKLGLDAKIVVNPFGAPSSDTQAFGFEELIQKAKQYAREALVSQDSDLGIGIGIESALSFIYAANEWYYVMCIAAQTKNGGTATSFTSGVSVPEWMIKELQNNSTKTLHSLIEHAAGHPVDPIAFFSGYSLSRKETMLPPLLLTISQLTIYGK